MIEFVVLGTPAPQGSKRAVGRSKAGKTLMIESSKKVPVWREAVKWAAYNARKGAAPIDCAVIVRMVFTMRCPKRHERYPMRTPDLSKLSRCTEDAITDAGLWTDDARVVEYERLAKVYPGTDPEALDVPGVRVQIRIKE